MVADIINYGVRLFIIVLGILFLSGVLMPNVADVTFVRIIGVIFILFGAYRVMSYYTYKKRIQRDNDRSLKYDFQIKNIEDIKKPEEDDDDEEKK